MSTRFVDLVMPPELSRRRVDEALPGLVASLSLEQLIEVVEDAAGRHKDVAQAVRLAAARTDGNLLVLRQELDRAFRTRRFLDYRESMEWSQAADPVVAELDRMVKSAPSRKLVELIQRSTAHVVNVMHRADDSSGLIGSVGRQLLDLHARTCDAGVADPVRLAAWMIRFRFTDQDWFDIDPVRYRAALGEAGMAAYREAIDQIGDSDSFGVRYVRERLAVLDCDIEGIVRLHARDLSNPFQYLHVAEAMVEIGRDDLALDWTLRGISETESWDMSPLYNLACEIRARLEQPAEVLRLRRAHHERAPSSSTYASLRDAAQVLDAWDVERDAARGVLEQSNLRGFIDALIADGDDVLAWDVAVAAEDTVDKRQWLQLAARREVEHPADAFAVYHALAEETLEVADRRAYSEGVRILKKAERAAEAGEIGGLFAQQVGRLRERYRRRPTLIAMLDKAGFV